MNATCPQITDPIMAASGADCQQRPVDRNLDAASHFLYQAATVLAILLFLVSF